MDDEPSEDRMALYERAIYLRGLFIQRYAAIEFSLTHLLMMAREHPTYQALGDLPFKLKSKLNRLTAIISMDGPIKPYAAELKGMVDYFVELEGDRHFLAHGLIATIINDEGERVLAFRLYDHIDGQVAAGFWNITLTDFEELAALLSPTASNFSKLVAKIEREKLLPPPRNASKSE